MPIVNGKYQNPGWINGNRPAVNAQNLNDISDTLERLDSQENGGGKRYASLVVGTSAAGWSAADCDYLCDGTDDQVEIQAAIDALYPNGGEVLILAGTYHLSGPVQTVESAGKYMVSVVIRGEGDDGTILKRMAAGPFSEAEKYLIGITQYSCLRDICVDGGNISLGPGEDRWEVTAVIDCAVENCRFINAKGIALGCDWLPVVGVVQVSHNTFYYNEKDIQITASGNISHNTFSDGGTITSKPGAKAALIGNRFEGGTITLNGLRKGGVVGHNSGIYKLSILNTQTEVENLGEECLVSGNTFVPGGTVPAVVLGASTANNFVTGNLFAPNAGANYVQDSGKNNVVRFNSGDTGSGGTLPAAVLVTLRAAGWSGGRQTVAVQGVSASEGTQLIPPPPAAASQSAYYAAGVRATAQGADSLTFAADTVPTADLSVYVVIQEVA